MNDASSERRERLEMLLAEEAVGHLSDEDQVELIRLLLEFPEVDREGFQRAAASFGLVFADRKKADRSELSKKLKQAILDDAVNFLPSVDRSKSMAPSAVPKTADPNHGGIQVVPSANGKPRPVDVVDSVRSGGTASGGNHESLERQASIARFDGRNADGIDWWRWTGWVVATAALFCLMLLNLTGPDEPTVGGGVELAANNTAVSEISFQQLKSDLLQQPSTRSFSWTTGPTPLEAKVQGDVVWNQEEQAGFMTFKGLPENDPLVHQYQLWIIDPMRDEHPIDGGVFDIVGEGEIVVPINAKLEVIDPKAFAITIEKPGGVVVSDQSKLPLLAPVD